MRNYIPCFDADFTMEDRSAAMAHLAMTDYWTSGKKVDEFERVFSKYVGRQFATMTNSGSSALFAAIYSMGWKPGDKIITPAVTFPTAISPLLWLGLVPVLVDVDDTLNIDPQKMEDSIKAVGGVEGAVIPHTLGNPVHPDVWGFFDRSVEDCCDALGSKIQGYSCGKFGTVSCFSFYPAHHITTIEGGMTLTNSPFHAETIRRFVNWGRACWCRPGQDNSCGKRHDSIVDGVPWDHKYEFVLPGGNFKPGFDIQGVIGLQQLAKEEIYRERRKENFRIIWEYLCDAEFIGPAISGGSSVIPCWFGIAIKHKRIHRKILIERLEKAGVGTRLVFGGNMARQKFLSGRDQCLIPGSLKKADEIMRDWFVIGCNHTITEDEAHYIGETVRKAVTE